jgi:hypothetical protein
MRGKGGQRKPEKAGKAKKARNYTVGRLMGQKAPEFSKSKGAAIG